MSDTKIENAIIQAIDIIAKKRVAQAGFDRTIKAVVNKVLDSTIGKYQIKYQDSLFQAYATSAKVSYKEQQQVIILIPGNDWDRVKVILNGTQHWSTTYDSIPIVDDEFNIIGNNLITLNEEIGLSSYVNDNNVVLTKKINIKQLSDYIKQGNSIIFGMKVQTKLASSQVGGKYGLRFYCTFENDVTGQQETRIFEVDSSDAMGNPYGLISPQWVKNSYPNIDTQNFVKIDGVIAWVSDFPQDKSKADIKDILISEISVNGANILTEEELNGYSLHIDSTESGLIIDAQTAAVPLTAQLKVKGVVMPQSDKLNFYWFRENGTVFRGDPRYFGYGGDGWECLNVKQDNAFVTLHTGKYIFNTVEDVPGTSANMPNSVNKIKCVVVYDNHPYSKQIEVINSNIKTNLIISSSDKQLGKDGTPENQTIYYLGNGLPTFTCRQINEQGKEQDIEGTCIYTWSVTPYRGNTVQKPKEKEEDEEESENDFLIRVYEAYKEAKEGQEEKADSMDNQSRKKYIETTDYTTAISNWESVKGKQYIDGNKYINFPVSSIITSSTIRCAVTKNNVYIGTASITLYNKMQLEGMYSLNLEYGTQVFQYDGKGNSPTSPQLEKPLEIHPLTFTLLDNQGKQITHENIRRNGYIKWIIPIDQTLLISKQAGGVSGYTDLTVTSTDLPLAASDYQVYSSSVSTFDSFDYTIADTYDKKKDINYIWLNVKYKDMIFDAYTNFTFPKDGDPGTNGTDYVVKLVPQTGSERIYCATKPVGNTFFDDNGATENLDKLKFQLYNNSKKIENINPTQWTCPPKALDLPKQGKININKHIVNTYINIGRENKLEVIDSSSSFTNALKNIKDKKPVNIVRAGYKGDKDIKYYAEFPICYNYTVIEQEGENSVHYRFKVKPKTGFSYVVYSEDGTRPDYDNTLPFEIIVEKYEHPYYKKIGLGSEEGILYYKWQIIGNLKANDINNNITNKIQIQPEDTFDGYDLSSAIICSVYKEHHYEDNVHTYSSPIGFIHIPIYMILNRYGHTALNSWDGNSIQLNANGDTVLAPQVGAGKKETSDNTFTGVLIGNQKTLKKNEITNQIEETDQTGLFGYNQGQRSIFLDANSGSATFGKQGASQIKIDASSGQGTIKSGDYEQSTKKEDGSTNHDGKGMKIKFSSTEGEDGLGPYIRFGSDNFHVTADGSLHASGDGDIAGWNITDNRLYKNNTGVSSYGYGISEIGATLPAKIKQDDSEATVAFYAGTESAKNNFYVTHDGFLFSKSGQIAGWDFDNQKLHKDAVGMNSDPTNNEYKLSPWPDGKNHYAKAFFANGDKFYVTHDGYLRSTSGKIATWDITAPRLTNGSVGMGELIFKYNSQNQNNPFGQQIDARFWGADNSDDKNLVINGDTVEDSNNSNIDTLNFAVSNKGKLYSKAGKIGGWNITKNELSSNDLHIHSNGSIYSNNYNSQTINNREIGTSGWKITSDGEAHFTYGDIAGWLINDFYLSGGDVTLNKSGDISCDSSGINHWKIKSNGDAYFSKIYGTVKSGQTFSSNDITMSGSGGYGYVNPNSVRTSWGQNGVGNQTLKDYIESLALKNLYTQFLSSFSARIPMINCAGFTVLSSITASTVTDSNGNIGISYDFNPNSAVFSIGSQGNIMTQGNQAWSGKITFLDTTNFTFTNGLLTNVSPGQASTVLPY